MAFSKSQYTKYDYLVVILKFVVTAFILWTCIPVAIGADTGESSKVAAGLAGSVIGYWVSGR